jgi:PAS domain S-box-containing protein
VSCCDFDGDRPVREVSCRLPALALEGLERRGLPLVPVLGGLDRELLMDGSARLDWDDCVAFFERVERVAGGAQALEQLFVPNAGATNDHPVVMVARYLGTPAQLYDVFVRWGFPAEVRGVTGRMTEHGAGRCTLEVTLPRGRRGSPEVLRFTAGMLRQVPRLFGLGEAAVRSAITSHHARYEVVAPLSHSRWQRLGRSARAVLGMSATLRTLEAQQQEIHEQHRLLLEQLAAAGDADRRLTESEARFRAAAEGSLDAFYLFEARRDGDGKVVDFTIVDLNERGAQVLGSTRGELLGQSLAEKRPVSRAGFIDRFAQVIETRRAYEEEFSIDPPEGRRWRRQQVVAVGDGVAVTMRDVTGQVLAAEALRTSERSLRLALSAARMGTWNWNIAKGTVEWSPGVADIFGIDGASFDGRFESYLALIHPDDLGPLRASIDRALTGGEAYEVEHRVLRADGSIGWLAGKGTVLHDAHGAAIGMAGTVTDVSEQKRLESQLLLANRMISVGTLAAGVAHEINNPLAYVLGNLTRAQRALDTHGVEDARAELEQALAAVADGARRVQSIVGDLKTFSRPEEDRTAVLDLAQVVGAGLRLVDHDLRHRATIVRSDSVAPPVRANEARLAQVVVNLVLNAAHALPERPRQDNRIEVSVGGDGARAVIAVRDNGRGMDEATRRMAFDPFFTTKPVGEGTGLGLSICHGIVAALGGSIELESRVGEGTTVRVLLPAAPHDAAEAPPPPTAPPVVSSVASTARVLVVDDEPLIVSMLEGLLRIEGHSVTGCTVAPEALALIDQGRRFDVVLCDLMMPGLSGMDLYAALCDRAPEQATRFVFLTGGAFTPRARRFLDSVPNPRLEKPFSVDAVLDLVRRVATRPTAPGP